MTDCDDCGGELVDLRDKNMSGWWRDRCLPCIRKEHGHGLADEEILGSRPQFRVTVAETDDGQYRAFEEGSDSDLSGRGPTRPAAIARYLDLISDRISVHVDGGESDD